MCTDATYIVLNELSAILEITSNNLHFIHVIAHVLRFMRCALCVIDTSSTSISEVIWMDIRRSTMPLKQTLSVVLQVQDEGTHIFAKAVILL